jgi:hypothetical protein
LACEYSFDLPSLEHVHVYLDPWRGHCWTHYIYDDFQEAAREAFGRKDLVAHTMLKLWAEEPENLTEDEDESDEDEDELEEDEDGSGENEDSSDEDLYVPN